MLARPPLSGTKLKSDQTLWEGKVYVKIAFISSVSEMFSCYFSSFRNDVESFL